MTSDDKRTLKRWHWRTWDLLRQIERATDGESPEQRSGVTTCRGIGVSDGDPRIRAFVRLALVECVDSGEIVGGDGYGKTDSKGAAVVRPIWCITLAGREVLHSAVGLKAKEAAGISITEKTA